ncbi:Fc receptor-like protein 2 isoform X3 [Dromiciops gliroides]|uniref:Fc receptor-like protein 2 isoform X3 n=1 Tax=Dromiciops gliroides TaxID=33562 RepID=UPI001CC604EE|nr:Fc receptor-like protein 2 isoform X3 [Dromiciops gliroides]
MPGNYVQAPSTYAVLFSHQAIAKKAVVHLSPPWTTIFNGEKVTLTCHGFNSSKSAITQWYKNQQLQAFWSTNSIETNQTGQYRCQTQGSALSDPVNLVVSSDSPILQTPYSVFEGDTLVLRCREWNNRSSKDVTYYKDGKELPDYPKDSDLSISIPQVDLSYSGKFHCTVFQYIPWRKHSRKVQLQVQELFSPPELKTTTSKPTEGTPVTLSCETQCHPQRSGTELHFSFIRDGTVITSGWNKSQVLHIPNIWKEDSGSYWCKAKAVAQNIRKQSNPVKISVKRIPISGILMETQPSEGQVIEGEKLVLTCSVSQGTGNITFSWHREGINASLGRKTQCSLEEKLVLSAVNESDAGKYYCTADNKISAMSSLRVNVTVKIPVSQPLFSVSALGAHSTVGDVVEFQCKVLRGSFPIQYQLYHGKAILENKITPSGGAAFFNLTMTTGHSGEYFCKANNSFSWKLSEILTLSISVPRSQKNMAFVGIIVALLSILILTTITFMFYFKLLRNSGGHSAPSQHRASPISNFQEPVYLNSSPQMELVPIYVNPVVGDVVYSEAFYKEHGKEANHTENPPEDKDSSVIYAEVKKKHRPRDSEKAKSAEISQEDVAEVYENIKLF